VPRINLPQPADQHLRAATPHHLWESEMAFARQPTVALLDGRASVVPARWPVV